MVIKCHIKEGSDGARSGPEHPLDGMRPTRRTALAGGLGITALIAFPDLLAGSPASAAVTAPAGAGGATSTAPHFFLYGTTGPRTRPGVEQRQPPSAAASPAANLVTGLDVAPVKSADGSTLALASTSPTGTSRSVTLALVDTRSGPCRAARWRYPPRRPPHRS